jgi:hypothetical protein
MGTFRSERASARRLQSALARRSHRPTCRLVDPSQRVADLGCFRVVVLVLHGEQGGDGVDHELSEPDAVIILHALIERIELLDELLGALDG